eukprot:gene11773-12845_t
MSDLPSQEGFVSQQIKIVFGHTNLYEIFQVTSTATTNEIKKAYMKLALKHHPDKGGDAATFQAISMIHTILSDEDKRKLYDECGLLNPDDDENDHFDEKNFDFWNEYFRNLFPKLTVSAIEKFAKEYIGSKEEENDLINAYEKYDGNCVKMMEVIMFAELGEEQRIVHRIDHFIEEGRIKKTKAYDKNRKKLLERYDQFINGLIEQQEEEGDDLIDAEDEGEMEVEENDIDEEEEEENIQSKGKKRDRGKQGGNDKKSNNNHQKKETKKKQKKSEPSLEELILAKNKRKVNSSQDLFSKIISKYSDGKESADIEDDPLPDDDEFDKFQKSLFANNKDKGKIENDKKVRQSKSSKSKK